jgi:hypothetical protein
MAIALKNNEAVTAAEAPAGMVIKLPLSSVRPYVPQDVSAQYLDKMARGFIVGTETVSRSRDVRRDLEERVVKRIGRKGKYLVDKIFELIEGVYLVDNVAGKAVRYYKVPPSLPAIVYAMDRVLGKPKQTIDKSEEKRGIMVVEHIIRNLAEPNSKNGNKPGSIAGVGGSLGVLAAGGGSGNADSVGV